MNFKLPFWMTAMLVAWNMTIFAADENGLTNTDISKVMNRGSVMSRDEKLQHAFLQFPLLPMVTNSAGEPDFQTLTLTNSVKCGKETYCGFRFTVPARNDREDFVWAFVEPYSFEDWYIVPQSGTMDGFLDYFYRPRKNYRQAVGLFPRKGENVILQYLSGSDLKDRQTYLIWFGFKKRYPTHISVEFTFVNLKRDKLKPLEAALGLDPRHQ